MSLGSMQVVNGADGSAAGLGRLGPYSAAVLALAADAHLKCWLDADPLWQLPAAGSTNGAPADRQGSNGFTMTGVTAATGINGKPTFNFPGGAGPGIFSTGNVLPAADWTLSLVGKPSTSAEILFCAGSATSSSGMGIERNASNGIQMIVNGSSAPILSSNGIWASGTILHVEVCYTQSTKLMSLLINGVLNTSHTLAADQSNLTLCLGDDANSANGWKGDLAEFMVWDVDLSAVANPVRQANLRTHITAKFGV
ncbi:MAG: LamG-like jellyroll fold domain-containing protein [Rhizomicrobium sp.]